MLNIIKHLLGSNRKRCLSRLIGLGHKMCVILIMAWLLAGHCCFVTASSSLVRGSFLSTRRAFGEPWEVFGMVPGWPEQVPGLFMMPMGSARQPTSDWDLRFPMFLAHMSIWAYDLQCFTNQPRESNIEWYLYKNINVELYKAVTRLKSQALFIEVDLLRS